MKKPLKLKSIPVGFYGHTSGRRTVPRPFGFGSQSYVLRVRPGKLQSLYVFKDGHCCYADWSKHDALFLAFVNEGAWTRFKRCPFEKVDAK